MRPRSSAGNHRGPLASRLAISSELISATDPCGASDRSPCRRKGAFKALSTLIVAARGSTLGGRQVDGGRPAGGGRMSCPHGCIMCLQRRTSGCTDARVMSVSWSLIRPSHHLCCCVSNLVSDDVDDLITDGRSVRSMATVDIVR